MKRFVGIILMLLLLPALAMAQEAGHVGGTELIDWTALVVAVIGVIGNGASRCWGAYG